MNNEILELHSDVAFLGKSTSSKSDLLDWKLIPNYAYVRYTRPGGISNNWHVRFTLSGSLRLCHWENAAKCNSSSRNPLRRINLHKFTFLICTRLLGRNFESCFSITPESKLRMSWDGGWRWSSLSSSVEQPLDGCFNKIWWFNWMKKSRLSTSKRSA